MSQADIQKWDARYRAREACGAPEPDPALVRFWALLPKGGAALDLACGLGGNTLYLARQGFTISALDGSAVALERLREQATAEGLRDRVRCQQVDLDHYQLPEAAFDLIIVMHFLNRELFGGIARALRPGGTLVYKTFNRNILQTRPGFNPDYTIENTQLRAAFAGLKTVVMGDPSDPQNAFLIARKPA